MRRGRQKKRCAQLPEHGDSCCTCHMSWTSTGADLSAVTAAIVWTRGQLQERQAPTRARADRNWHGYIDASEISSSYVREVGQPEGAPRSHGVVEVVDRNGNPDDIMASALRARVNGEGILARAPTAEEYEFLADLRKQRHGRGGLPVRSYRRPS